MATRIKSSKDTVTNTWAVKLAPHTLSLLEEINALADRVAMEMGAVNLGRIEPFQDLYKFTKNTKTRNVRDDNILENHSNILWSSKQVVLKRTKRSGFPLISRGFPSASFNDPKYIDQWHLHNSREKGHDVNATGIWNHNITGRGVVVAVVDDGLEYTNTDLLSNYVNNYIVVRNNYSSTTHTHTHTHTHTPHTHTTHTHTHTHIHRNHWVAMTSIVTILTLHPTSAQSWTTHTAPGTHTHTHTHTMLRSASYFGPKLSISGEKDYYK